ncbi:unnamed protein product, partial [Ectocarpus sp. 12 AP-2014]
VRPADIDQEWWTWTLARLLPSPGKRLYFQARLHDRRVWECGNCCGLYFGCIPHILWTFCSSRAYVMCAGRTFGYLVSLTGYL